MGVELDCARVVDVLNPEVLGNVVDVAMVEFNASEIEDKLLMSPKKSKESRALSSFEGTVSVCSNR